MRINPDRFWRKVNSGAPDACWLWSGKLCPDGYGRYHINKRDRPGAHRVAWTLTYGDIPAGFFVCHRCDVPACCNPLHLFVGTNADNLRDMREKGRSNRGTRHHSAKLSDSDVARIRARKAAGERTKDIAREYSIHPVSVRNIVRGKTWSHL